MAAVIVTVPGANALTTPLDAIVATRPFDDVQRTG